MYFVQISSASIHQSKIDPNAPNHDAVVDGIMIEKPMEPQSYLTKDYQMNSYKRNQQDF